MILKVMLLILLPGRNDSGARHDGSSLVIPGESIWMLANFAAIDSGSVWIDVVSAGFDFIPMWNDFDSDRIHFDSRNLIPPLARIDSGVGTIDSIVNTN